MPKQKAESYFDPGQLPAPPAARCVFSDCANDIIAEVHKSSYGDALAAFRGVNRDKLKTRRKYDERLFICQLHLGEPWLKKTGIQWQMILPLERQP